MGTSYTYEAEGLDNLERNMNNSDTVVRISVNEGFRALQRLVVPVLRAFTPRRSGKLARETTSEILGQLDNQSLEVRQSSRSENGVFYGYIVREGRGPIVAKRAKALHFFIGDQEFFRHSVGPALPNPYHIRAMESMKGGIQEIVNQMGARLT